MTLLNTKQLAPTPRPEKQLVWSRYGFADLGRHPDGPLKTPRKPTAEDTKLNSGKNPLVITK